MTSESMPTPEKPDATQDQEGNTSRVSSKDQYLDQLIDEERDSLGDGARRELSED